MTDIIRLVILAVLLCLIISIIRGLNLYRLAEILHVDTMDFFRRYYYDDSGDFLRFLKKRYEEQDTLLRWRLLNLFKKSASDDDSIKLAAQIITDRTSRYDYSTWSGEVVFFSILNREAVSERETGDDREVRGQLIVINDAPVKLIDDLTNLDWAHDEIEDLESRMR